MSSEFVAVEDLCAEYQALTKDTIDASVEAIQRVTEVEDESNQLWCLALFISLVEYANAGRALASKKISVADDAIFRSFLEGFVDLKNLVGDVGYAKHLMLEHHLNWQKVHEAAGRGNPFFSAIAGDPRHADSLIGHKAEMERLKALGAKKLQILQKFELAGMQTEYESIYAFSSRDVHNSLSALMRRHFEVDGEQTILKLNHWEPDRCSLRLDGYISMILDALSMLANYLGKDFSDLTVALGRKLTRLRERNAKTESDSVGDT